MTPESLLTDGGITVLTTWLRTLNLPFEDCGTTLNDVAQFLADMMAQTGPARLNVYQNHITVTFESPPLEWTALVKSSALVKVKYAGVLSKADGSGIPVLALFWGRRE